MCLRARARVRLAGGKGGTYAPHMADTYPLGDDQTSKLLQDSRLLRTQLHTLAAFEPVYIASAPQAYALTRAIEEEEAQAQRLLAQRAAAQDVAVHGVEFSHAGGQGAAHVVAHAGGGQVQQQQQPDSW